jgi:TonB-dependent SusC/RagA subfamily outer membrane receptor
LDASVEKELLNKELLSIDKQFNEFNVSDETQKGIITIKLSSEVRTTLSINVTYLVSEAGWFPTYDIRANTINAPVDLLYKSHIYQKTGVNWENVDLVLSTGDPNTDNNKPYVDTKFLNFIRPGSYKNPANAVSSFKYKYNPNVRNVTGAVYDDNGPIPGANVVIAGTNQGTQTDFDGRYSLEVNTGENLQFSYVGYQSKQIPVHASTINVTLEADSSLDEVVVTARGIKREKRSLGYAVSEALEGQATGVHSGTSGSATNVVIRGFNSINGNTQALFIVDGVPFDSGTGNSSSSRFLDLDPDQIANVEVLKGLAASTLYGTAGRNGVILITTKSGTATGQLKVEDLTTTRFEISKPYSIQTDGDVTVIKIDNFQVLAEYEYYAAPLLNENVFLTAKIKNWEQYSLLPGEANIYFEGGFSGKTYIDPLATTRELIISLGVDPNVIVKRKQIDNFKASTFIGNQRILDNEFVLNIKNNKSSDINLKLVDRIPKSQNKEIKVDEIETGDANYDKETSLLNWALDIATKSSVEKRFSYRLKYPKSKSINL